MENWKKKSVITTTHFLLHIKPDTLSDLETFFFFLNTQAEIKIDSFILLIDTQSVMRSHHNACEPVN